MKELRDLKDLPIHDVQPKGDAGACIETTPRMHPTFYAGRGRDAPFPHQNTKRMSTRREIGILLPNNQHQHRTLHIQKDVLPYALC